MDFAHVFDGLTPMGAAFGNEQHPTVIRTEGAAIPAAISRRRRSKVDDDVKNSSPSTSNEFGLERWLRLIVKTANRAPENTQPHVRLQRCELNSVLDEFALAPRSHEAAPAIASDRRFDKSDAKNCTVIKIHTVTSVLHQSISGRRY